MACADCGKKAAAGQPCRTFTFPLEEGTVEIVIRGEPRDLELLKVYAGFIFDVFDQIPPEKGTRP